MPRAVTRAVSIAAPAGKVFELVADPMSMTRYAPGFARSMRPDGGGWIVETARGTLRLERRLDPGAGTADFQLTAADGRANMVFTRTVPVGAGSELVFTLQLPGSAPDDAVASQGPILEEELAHFKTICEQG